MTRLDEEFSPKQIAASNLTDKGIVQRDSLGSPRGASHADLATSATVNLFVPDDTVETSPASPRQQRNSSRDLTLKQHTLLQRQSSASSSSDIIAPLEPSNRPSPRPVLKKSSSQMQLELQNPDGTNTTKARPLLKSMSNSNIEKQRFQPAPSNSTVKRSILKRSDSCSSRHDSEEAEEVAGMPIRRSPSRQLSFADDKKKPLEIIHHVPDTHYPTRKTFLCGGCCSIQ